MADVDYGTLADGSDGMTVGQAAAAIGVTVRTLHHWDEVGVACPSQRTHAGYRLYTGADLARLQRIVVYRELDLPLNEIKSLLDDPASAVPVDALRAQRQHIAERIDRLERLAAGMDRMIAAHEHGVLLSAEQQAAIFGPDWDPTWAAGARERWGDTAQWAQFAERAATRSPQEWQDIADAMADLDVALGVAMDEKVDPGSAQANRLAERHRGALSSYFPVTHQMHVCIGRMYETETEFAVRQNAIRPGMASWLRHVIDANAHAHGIDPDTATWT